MTEVSTLVALSRPTTTVTKSTTTATSGSETLPLSNTDDIVIGMKVSGTNLAENSIVTAISSGVNITMSKEATASGATGTVTFTKTAFDTPTNPQLCVSTTSTSVDTFGVVVAEESSGSITLTSVGRSTLANCNATQNSNVVTLSSGNTNSLYVGQSVNGTGFTGTQARIESIISSTEFILTEKASASATNATYVLGLEHRNLTVTEGIRIKCFDDITQTGVRLNSIDLTTTHLFVMIHSDNENKHHFAKVSEIFTDDISGDSFEFRPKLGNEIAKDVKFKLFSTPISNNITEVAVGLGIKSTLAPSVSLARPLFYFFNENLDKKNELDHNKKYSLFYSELDFISGATDALSATSFFTTTPDFGTDIIDYSKYTLKTRLVDNLKNQDSPVTHTSNEGKTILTYTPFTSDACFTNARRDDNDAVTNTTSTQDYNGPYRYLSYGFSKDKANLSYNVLDQLLFESMGAKGTMAEIKLADPFRVLTKKIGDEESLRIRHQLFSGDMNEFKSIGAVITSNPSGNTYATTTDHDLGSYLNVGDEVRVGTRIVIVQSIASISGKTQNITFRSENRLETESIFTTGSYTLANDSILERRAYNKKDKTLLTDFSLVENRNSALRIKFFSKEFSFLYATVSAVDVDKKLLTLSFFDKAYFDSDGSTSNEAAYHSQGTMLDYMKGRYAILVEKLNGAVERIDNFKENGLTQVKLEGRSDIRKLISPVITKNTLFSQDIIYSTQSPYNKLESVSANFTCSFASKTLTSSASITLTAGTKVHLKHSSGMMGYIGEIESTVTGTSFDLVDNARAEGTALAGYKETNKNYLLNKALATNTLVDSTTSLSGASNKGLFFNSGVKITPTGEEGDNLVGSSGSTHENAVGYEISDVSNMLSDAHFQSRLHNDVILTGTTVSGDATITALSSTANLFAGMEVSGTNIPTGTTVSSITNSNTLELSANATGSATGVSLTFSNKATFDTVNTLLDFEIVETKSAGENAGTILTIAPYNPLTLGRIDINYANTQDTTFSKTNLGKTSHDFTTSRRYIDVDSDEIVSAYNHIRGERNMHGKPIYINGKFLANVLQAEKSVELKYATNWTGGSATATVDVRNGLSEGLVLSGDSDVNSLTITAIDRTDTSSPFNITLSGNAGGVGAGNADITFSLPSTHSRIYLDREVGLIEVPCKLNSNKTITDVSSTEKIYVGMKVTGTGIPSNTTVTSIDSNTKITISNDATNSNANVSLTFVIASNTVIDRLSGHHNQDSSRETSKLTHEFNLLNGGHLHTGKTISLLHPKLNLTNQHNITSVLDYRMNGEQPFHQRTNSSGGTASNKAVNILGSKLDEFGTYQSNFGASNYRLNNIETGNYNKSKNILFEPDEISFYTETLSKIKYYASGYRFNSGYYTDGFLQNNIIGTDICGMNIIGQGQIQTSSGSAYLQVTHESFFGNMNTNFMDIFRIGQKIEASGIPDNTFVGNIINIGDYTTTTRQVRLTDLSANPVNATASASFVNAKFYEFDNKRLIESRGFIPSIGDKFYSPNTLESKSTDFYDLDVFQRGGQQRVFFSPLPSGKLVQTATTTLGAKLRNAAQFRDEIEHFDPKIARMFLFSNSDILPYSSTRKDSLLNKTVSRNLLNYSLLALQEEKLTSRSDLKEGSLGTTNTITRLDDSYNAFNITEVKDDKSVNELKRFSLMRLTEVVFDIFYNQFDPENVPSNDKNIGIIGNYPRFPLQAVTSSSGGVAIGSVSGTTINTIRIDTGGATTANNLVQKDILVDKAGRFIGVVDSVGTNTITTAVNVCKTDLATDSTGDYYSPRLNNASGSSPNGAFMQLYKIDFETQDLASSSNTFGVGSITGYNTENDFVEIDGKINLLQMGIMRGLASDGGTYVATTANRGNADSGYGGNSATYTDTTFATRRGVAAMPSGQIDNEMEDCSIILPIGLAGTTSYYSHLAQIITGAGPNSNDIPFLNSQIFPVLGKLAYQGNTIVTSSGFYNGADSLGFLHNSSTGTGGIERIATTRLFQNHIPVFFDRFNIVGGSGAKADVGMTGTKIGNSIGLNVDGSGVSAALVEVRFGLVTRTIHSDNTLDPAGFATKTIATDSTTSNSAPTYDNDADGVFAGFKPTLRIDAGYIINGTFNIGASTKAKFTTTSTIYGDETIGADTHLSMYIQSSHVPKFTRTYELNTTPNPDEIRMTGNATSAGTDSNVRVSRNYVGSDTATNGTEVHTLAFTDYQILRGETGRAQFSGFIKSDNINWLSYIDLTGCYLVGEEVKRYNATGDSVEDYETAGTNGIGGSHGLGAAQNQERYSINEGTPKYMLYVISHEIDTSRQDRTHLITVSGTFPDAASSGNSSNRFKSFRIMQPNHTCFYDFSPKKIRLNQLASHYTKKPKEDSVYDERINHFMFKDRPAQRTQEGAQEGVLSMYVVVDPDGQTSDGNLVVSNPALLRNNIMKEGQFRMNISDGNNNNLTNISFVDEGDDVRFSITLEEQKEMLGVVSVSETIDVVVDGNETAIGKRALIGSIVSVSQDADKLINEILEENDVKFNLTESSYPYFVAPNYRGVDLFSAIKFLMNKKDKILIENNEEFTFEESASSNFFPNILFTTANTDTRIYSYSREKSQFDLFNEIIVFGKSHRAIRKELRSIKKKGKKTLQVFENELITQEDVDKRATELLRIHNDEGFGLKINVGHKGVSQLRVGDVITVEIPEENIPRSEFIVLEIQHNLTGTMDLELGSYTKGLEDRFAELAIENRNVNNKIREDSFNDNQNVFDFMENINVKPIKFKIQKKSTPAGAFTLGTNSTDSETLNTNTNALNIGVTTFTTLLEEEF